MKLIYISNSRMPTELAHGLQVMQMSEAFAENDCRVELVVPRRVNKIKQDPFSYYDIKKIFSYTKLPCLDLIFWNSGSVFFLIQTLTFLLSTRIFLLFRKYDILYTREQMVGLFFKGYVFEVHSLPKKVRAIHRFLWRRAGKFVVLTSFIKSRLVEEGIASEKIIVSPDGVNLSKFDISLSKKEAREKLKLPSGLLIGYVGMLRTLGMEKGIDTAIDAMTKINKPDARLVLVGGYKNDIDFYRQMASSLGVEDKVIFVGKVNHAMIPIYLKAFDVLVAPFPENEHYKYYMSPMKIFEYMASSRPIVSTRLPSLEEIIGEGEALLVAPENSSELAHGLENVLNDDGLADSLQKRAFATILNYTWQNRAKKIIQVFA